MAKAKSVTAVDQPSSMKRLSDFVTDARVIASAVVAIIVALVTASVWLSRWEADVVKRKDLQAEHERVSAENSRITEGALEVKERVIRLEAGQDWIMSTLAAVADKVGVPVPPPPVSSSRPSGSLRH